MRTWRSLWVGVILLVVFVVPGCGGKHHASTEPTAPPAALPDGIVTDSSPRQSSNVTEGEIVVTGSGSGSGPEIIEIPMSAQQFAIVQLEATSVDGIGDPGMPAIARIGHQMGAYSLAPPSNGVSTYGIPRTDSARTFARHFTGGGNLRLELTNQLEGSEVPTDESVRWRYKIAQVRTPDVAETERAGNRVAATPLNVDEEYEESLSRGWSNHKWHMRREFTFQPAANTIYRLTLRPLVAEPEWRWHVSSRVTGDRSGAFEMANIGYGEEQSVEYKFGENTQSPRFRVWVDVPPGEVDKLQAASFALSLTQIPALSLPRITRVVPYLGNHSPWGTDPDGLPQLPESEVLAPVIIGNGCPCEISYSEMTPGGEVELTHHSDGGFYAGETGAHEVMVRLRNAIGISEPVSFRYRALPAAPVIRSIFRDGGAEGDFPLFDPIEIRVDVGYRISSLHLDFGSDAIPRFSDELLPTVRFLKRGTQTVLVTASNDLGTTTAKFRITVDPGFREYDFLKTPWWSPVIAGQPVTFDSGTHSEPDRIHWFLEGASPEAPPPGNTTSTTFLTPGWHHGAISAKTGGVAANARMFSVVVNPSGTTLHQPHRISGNPESQRELVAADWMNEKPFVVRYRDHIFEFLLYPNYPAPLAEDPPWTYGDAIPFMYGPLPDRTPKADLAIHDNTAYLLAALDGESPTLWAIDSNYSYELELPWSAALDPAQGSALWFALSPWQDRLIITESLKKGSANKVVQGALRLPAYPHDIRFTDRLLSTPTQYQTVCSQVATSAGVVVELRSTGHSRLMAVPLSSGEEVLPPLNSPAIVLPDGPEGWYQAGQLISDDVDRLWFLSIAPHGDDQDAIWLNSATFEDIPLSSNWERSVLPPSPHNGYEGSYWVINTLDGVWVQYQQENYARILELAPTGSDWQWLDRIDSFGWHQRLPHINDRGDLQVIQGVKTSDGTWGMHIVATN